MRIQLKQSEIVAAICQYLAHEGINLANKQVEVSFTASRSQGETLADVDIEPMADRPVEPVPVHRVTLEPLPVAEETTDTPVNADDEALEASPATKTSLFG